MFPPKLTRKDIARLETEIPKRDPVADRVGRTYTRGEIEKLEEQRLPWLRARRRRR